MKWLCDKEMTLC